MLKRRLALLTCIFCLTSLSAFGQSERYEAGQEALQEKNWSQAIKDFKAARADDPELADATLYWQAFAQYKSGQKRPAERTLKGLIKRYPDSPWIDDAKVLLQEHSARVPNSNDQIDEELRLYAIQQMALHNPEKGLPLVIELLEKSNSREVKSNALHILGISGSDEATDYLHRFILDEGDYELKINGIQMLSMRGNDDTSDILIRLYDKENNKNVKQAIISGFVHNNDQKPLLVLLEREKNPDLADQMIHMLGIGGDPDVLRKLYRAYPNAARKPAILNALAIAGDEEAIKDIINTEKDKKSRIAAIQSLVIVGGDDLDNFILEQFNKSNDPQEKEAFINLLIATDVDPEVVYQMAREEKDRRYQEQFINTLMVLDAPEYLAQLYRNDLPHSSKSAIINALGVSDSTDELERIYSIEKNPQLKTSVIHAFGLTGDDGGDFLLQAYKDPQANREIKKTVLNALMVQDNTDVLLELFKVEKDTQMKKQIIQMLSISGSDEFLEMLIENQE
ncbi:HEAT repeat domain-containing protein [Marinicella sp. W31]|uniref:HEAT repeat domain-containing protein n=1 Tax=Marinicella sp. W31 TaxID=3023713 RepID=UPI0037566F28